MRLTAICLFAWPPALLLARKPVEELFTVDSSCSGKHQDLDIAFSEVSQLVCSLPIRTDRALLTLYSEPQGHQEPHGLEEGQ